MKPKRGRIARLFSRKCWRLVQVITRVRWVHHPRWSFGWTAPFSTWIWFEDYGWRRAPRGAYHDCTTSGVY